MIKIDHIALYTTKLEEMKAFFIKFFNGKAGEMYHNQKSGFKSYFVTFDGGDRIEIMTRSEVSEKDKDEYPCGYHHISFSVGGREKVDSLTKELNDSGYITLSGPRTTGDGYYESQIYGPEGNIIEITE